MVVGILPKVAKMLQAVAKVVTIVVLSFSVLTF